MAIQMAIVMKSFAVQPSDAEIEAVIRTAVPKATGDDIQTALRIGAAWNAEDRRQAEAP